MLLCRRQWGQRPEVVMTLCSGTLVTSLGAVVMTSRGNKDHIDWLDGEVIDFYD